MKSEINKMAAEILHTTVEEAIKNTKAIPEIDAVYFWRPTRGGGAVIINSKGEKLAAGSSISFESHLKAFREGKRN